MATVRESTNLHPKHSKGQPLSSSGPSLSFKAWPYLRFEKWPSPRFEAGHPPNDLPTDGYDRNDVERLCARLICLREMREEVLVRSEMSIYYFMTLPSWGDAKVVEECHHLSSSLLERVPSHTTLPAAEGAMIPLLTPDEIVASLPDPRLAKKSKVSSQAEDVDEADLTDLCAKIENSLERDEGTSTKATSAPTPRLGKRLGAPHYVAIVSASELSHVRTLAHDYTSGCCFSLGGVVVSGHARKSRADVMWRQIDPLDSLARSALTRDVEYDQIPEDDFGIATRGEEIDLTLFPLTPGPYKMSYSYEDLSNCFNVPSALLVSHGAELNSCYTGLVMARNRLQEKFDRKAGYVKLLRSDVMTLDGKLESMLKDCDALGQENRELCSQKDDTSDKVKELQTELTDARVANIGLSEELSQADAKLSNQALVVRDLQNQLALGKAKSQGYKDAVDGLREKVARFVGSGKVSNIHIGAKADFDKALVNFPTTHFPFLDKIVAASVGTLSEMTQILPDKHIRPVTSAPVAPSIANEYADQVPLEHASDDLVASI
ncbi:hypothetical protein Tco_1002465 [Tanacetum coccineum]|uniref:Uncharacterized protein n=1 Tax=Tanacetum coccineum TaxID=301880 RepID=A0ABQ5F872_9ASTR